MKVKCMILISPWCCTFENVVTRLKDAVTRLSYNSCSNALTSHDKRLEMNFNLKDTPRENTLSNKTEALTKSMNMYIWAIGILNQLFIRDCYTSVKFSKNGRSLWQKFFLCDRSILYSSFHSS